MSPIPPHPQLRRPWSDAVVSHTARRFCSAWRSDNFIVGLTNESPEISPPVVGNYAVCGQYPGAVPSGATVNLRCSETASLPPARYVIAQFPVTNDYMNFNELNVCAVGQLRPNIASE